MASPRSGRGHPVGSANSLDGRPPRCARGRHDDELVAVFIWAEIIRKITTLRKVVDRDGRSSHEDLTQLSILINVLHFAS